MGPRTKLLAALAVGLVACSVRIEVGAFGDPKDAAPDGAVPNSTVPSIENPRKSVRLAAGGASTCAIAPSGTVKCWGRNEFGELGTGAESVSESSVPVAIRGNRTIVALTASAYAYCALSDTGKASCWGDSVFGQFARPGEATATIVHALSFAPLDVEKLEDGLSAVRSGLYYGAALTRDGRVRTWGLDGRGQLGLGAKTLSAFPSDVPITNARFVDVAASPAGFFTCGATTVGEVYCWGANSDGQLGDGTTTDRPIPVKVKGLEKKALEVTCGRAHACARVEGDRVYCWGASRVGQLGEGAGTGRNLAAPVPSLSAVVEVRAGNDHTCARLRDGEVWCWGANDWGQIGGDPLGSPDHGPLRAPDASFGADELAVGGRHSCVLRGSKVRCWGSNDWGQSGKGGAVDL